MNLLDSVISKLHSIDGITDARYIENTERQVILELEKKANRNAGLAIGVEIVNTAAANALQREFVVCINHSPALRHPRAPILVLTAGDYVVGEEVWEKEKIARLRADANALFLGRGFVLYKDKMTKLRKGHLRFEYGPQDFPEASSIPGVCDVVSSTISPPADLYIKKLAKWDTTDPDSGTVLIGFNPSS